MTISSEWDLLDQIRERIAVRGIAPPPDLVLGIGDDCAALALDRGTGLYTADISVEGVHFRRDYSSMEDIGYKAMAGNVSDIAAMGGRARLALVSLGVPATATSDAVMELYDGMLKAAAPAGLVIAGGDLSLAPQWIVSIALWGTAASDAVVRRAGARPGDTIYATGTLGSSRAGLEDLRAAAPTGHESLRERHRRPPVRIGLVPDIIDCFKPTAMIDISDGLLSDLRHLARASGTGFLVSPARIPVTADLRDWCQAMGCAFAEYVLSSGEEYELLFTSALPAERSPGSVGGIPVTAIGIITDHGCLLETPEGSREAPLAGYDHFAKKQPA